jgi:hypothetical protein
MAYPAHYLLQYGGSLHGTEQWSNSLRFVTDSATDIQSGQIPAALADIEADLRTFYGTSLFHPGMKVEFAKFNKIGPLGKYVDTEQSNTRFFTAPIVGTALNGHAPQVALVASLVTAAQRGLASKGRIFLAGLGVGPCQVEPANGQISVAQRDVYEEAVGTFLNNLNNWPGFDSNFAGLDLSVVSPGGLSGVGVARKVTGVRIGRVLDTQRRRRVDIDEDYGTPTAVS